MTDFDFYARDEARRQKADQERQAKAKALQVRYDTAPKLAAAFTPFARGVRYRESMNSKVDGPDVTFRDGARFIEIRVMDKPWFSVVRGNGDPASMPEFDRDSIKVDGANALMDLLDAWAQSKEEP